jgi:hypothetical protein
LSALVGLLLVTQILSEATTRSKTKRQRPRQNLQGKPNGEYEEYEYEYDNYDDYEENDNSRGAPFFHPYYA